MKNFLLIVLCLCSLIITGNSCKKDKLTELEKLPPVTQTGANTFGCLVNGKAWIPEGYNGNGEPNPTKTFDVDSNGFSYVQIHAKQFKQNIQNGSFIILMDSLNSIGPHIIYTSKKQIGFGSYLFPGCGILPNDNIQFKTGELIVSKYDTINGIISGIFSMKIKPINCDTLFFTDGRFDIKL